MTDDEQRKHNLAVLAQLDKMYRDKAIEEGRIKEPRAPERSYNMTPNFKESSMAKLRRANKWTMDPKPEEARTSVAAFHGMSEEAFNSLRPERRLQLANEAMPVKL
ncbi:MAG: hypothetical protein Q7T86_01660 [Hyphomicrobiaceae bacterium]|nr:hypothetical protein [Hyphomicrobiaceae bacterium]